MKMKMNMTKKIFFSANVYFYVGLYILLNLQIINSAEANIASTCQTLFSNSSKNIDDNLVDLEINDLTEPIDRSQKSKQYFIDTNGNILVINPTMSENESHYGDVLIPTENINKFFKIPIDVTFGKNYWGTAKKTSLFGNSFNEQNNFQIFNKNKTVVSILTYQSLQYSNSDFTPYLSKTYLTIWKSKYRFQVPYTDVVNKLSKLDSSLKKDNIIITGLISDRESTIIEFSNKDNLNIKFLLKFDDSVNYLNEYSFNIEQISYSKLESDNLNLEQNPRINRNLFPIPSPGKFGWTKLADTFTLFTDSNSYYYFFKENKLFLQTKFQKYGGEFYPEIYQIKDSNGQLYFIFKQDIEYRLISINKVSPQISTNLDISFLLEFITMKKNSLKWEDLTKFHSQRKRSIAIDKVLISNADDNKIKLQIDFREYYTNNSYAVNKISLTLNNKSTPDEFKNIFYRSYETFNETEYLNYFNSIVSEYVYLNDLKK